MKRTNVETITDTIFPLKTMTLLYITTETVRFNYIHSSHRQVPREIIQCYTTLDKRFPGLNFIQTSSRVEGMLEIQTKRFLWIALHRFPLTIDKITWSLTFFIDFYLLASPGSNYTLNWGYFERVADLNREKLEK